MGMDVSIRAYKDIYCPHCGEKVYEIPALDRNGDELHSYSFGHEWSAFLSEIGYDNKVYGEYVTLSEEDKNRLCEFIKSKYPPNYEDMALVIFSTPKDAVLKFEADW